MKGCTLFCAALLALSGCSTAPTRAPLTTAAHVDVARFMGDWYVIANIPTFIEKGAHNAVESYKLDADGSIATTFRFRKDSFDGKQKTYTPRGFVRGPPSNAVWHMQFVWPFKSDYRIVYLDEGYAHTIVGREKRDYVWIMARQPRVDEAQFQRLLALVGQQGYDTNRVQRVPQKWGSK